jgi:hypothetical protein
LSLNWGPGEKVKTEKWAPLSRRKMIFWVFFVIMATMRLLNIDAKKWSVDGVWDPSIHRRWHLNFHMERGKLRPPVVTLAERTGSWLGAGLSPGLFPLKHSLQKFPSCPSW